MRPQVFLSTGSVAYPRLSYFGALVHLSGFTGVLTAPNLRLSVPA